MKRFELDAEQADAILELKLYRLARLEILVIQNELADKRKRARQIAGLLKDEEGRWGLVRAELDEIQAKYAKGDKRRTLIEASEEVEFTADDFIVEEDNVVIVSRDGWLKRQKEVRDLSTTRLREGDSVLAVLQGSTRATVVFFTNLGAAYTTRIIDVPASTGYGEPVQKLFKLRDGERVVAAFSLDPRVAGQITPVAKKGKAPAADEPPPVHAIAATSDGYALRFSFEPFVEASTRAGRRFARPADGAEVVGVERITGEETLIVGDPRGPGAAVPGRRGELPVGTGQGRDPDQARGRRRRRDRLHGVAGRSRSDARRDQPRRRADDQHREVRGDRPRRQGPRTAAARSVQPHDSQRSADPARSRRPEPWCNLYT